MSMSGKLKARMAKAKQVGPNMNEATKGGGDYVPPEAGKNCRIRFIGFYEGGTFVEQSGQYAGKKNKKVKMDFELHGPRETWKPVEHDGKLIPKRLTLGGPFGINYSLNEKATFYKLFKTMSDCHPDAEATIMAELLGREFICDIEHKPSKDGKRNYANIVNIRKAEREDEDGNIVPIKIPEAITETKFFIHDIADREMWDELYIEGKYDDEKDKEGNVTREGKSKNVIQEWIMSADDFASSPIGLLLAAGGTAKDQEELDKALGGEDDDKPPFDTEEQEDAPPPATPDMTEMV